jgi:hypothetical protein
MNETGCLEWLDVAGTKEGGSPPDQEGEEPSVPRREARHQGLKIAAVERREASAQRYCARRVSQAQVRGDTGLRRRGTMVRLAALRPRFVAGERKAPALAGKDYGAARAAKQQGRRSVGCCCCAGLTSENRFKRAAA